MAAGPGRYSAARRRCPATGTAIVVTAATQRTPDHQGQHQAKDAGQHHDDARKVCMQARGERRRDSEPHDRPGRDQDDAGHSADHPAPVGQHDETAIAHQRAVPARMSQAILSITDPSVSDELAFV
jgi:hypothetical protein